MTDAVQRSTQGRIGILTINNPPVNALAAPVRDGIKSGIEAFGADPNIDAIVLIGGGRTFIAGADIREFGKPPRGANLNDVIAAMENCPKIVVAALHGTPLGGGLETALGAHYRVALPTTRVGLPEVHLGLLPGAGGTQRLPRLTGAKYALDAILSGRHIPAPEARSKGIVDALVEGDLLAGAVAHAQMLVAQKAPRRRVRDLDVTLESPDLFKDTEKAIARRARGFKAPWNIIKCVQAACELPFDEGMKRERELFVELVTSQESAAQRYYFFAEREAAKVLDVPADTPQREIKTAGIVGAGTMGGGIAMNFANAGIPVTLLEVKQEALDRGLKTIRTNYENTARRGGMKAEDVDKRMALIKPTLSYDDLKDADVVIEAVFETMEVKEGVFRKLDEIARPGAILATNTSGLDVNQIAAYTRRPGDVIGMHFFSPANVMKLLENVRGKATAKDVIATVMSLSKKIGKIPVLVGVCEGFVGNRMLRQRGVQSAYMLEEGALPQQVDKVIYDFGFPMGPFAMSDLAGNDVGWRIRQGKKEKEQRNVRYTGYIADAICELGRFGQKTGSGYYKYNLPDRTPIPDPEVEKIIEDTSKKLGITRRAISDQEILERCLYPMVNEGAKILAEGMAQRSLDIDVIWVNGYGWPVYRGGPMWWADNVVGLKTVHDALLKYRDASGDPFWEPAPLLKKLVQEDKKFSTV
ncbi:3-hydroxyacyl-CoA dehydrogenase NAD-binding domain-containing protein [Enhydrobacter sp.]|jgi:3-hydroxyacyl-CoA dehydrogenase|uniref:3-hydroxyacyl-CoA dehydrogenase NAD-binding domain-containing protein n=1 Tax=Enhydrobacter sp. TaxID=1894999 RepID=UPI002639DC96|nr:3-hydroxyacyl-CoA dehydrogenase NAD-binding domain-containing protein [Enhydrobacter sp.]WIM09771.1 MAG: 3-hydroxyacyl-CoA dehydrogenase [Enhydrobacter sp.]